MLVCVLTRKEEVMKKKISCIILILSVCITVSLQSMQQLSKVKPLITPVTTKSLSYWQRFKDSMQDFGNRSRSYFHNRSFYKPVYTTQITTQPQALVITPSQKATFWTSIVTTFKQLFGYHEQKSSVKDMFEELNTLLQNLTLKSESELLYSFSFEQYKEKWKNILTAEYNGTTLLDTLLNFFVSRDTLGNIQLQNLTYVGFIHPFFHTLVTNNVRFSSEGKKLAEQIYATINDLLAQGANATDTIRLEDFKYMLNQYKTDTEKS